MREVGVVTVDNGFIRGEVVRVAALRFSGLLAYSRAFAVCLLLFAGLSLPGALRAASTDAATSSQVKQDMTKTILVWGDSLSAAYGFDKDLGWPTLLAEKLQAEGLGYRVVNGSVSGETTVGGLARLPRALAAHSPDIVLLALGANDGLRALPTAAMKKQLASMIALSEAQGAKVLLFEMKVPPNYGPRYAEAFDAVFQELVAETGAVLVPFFLMDVVLKPEMMQSDNLHPTEAAQPVLLQRVWTALKPVIEVVD